MNPFITISSNDEDAFVEMHPVAMEYPPPLPAGVQVILDAVESLIAQSDVQPDEQDKPIRFREFL